MTDLPPPPQPTLVTSAVDHATVFADGVWFAANLSGCVRVTFLENMIEPQSSPHPGYKSRHVGTLVIPRDGFNSMIAYLNDMKLYFDQMDAANVHL